MPELMQVFNGMAHAGLNDKPLRKDISLAEVAQHKSAGDAWTVLNGKVCLRFNAA